MTRPRRPSPPHNFYPRPPRGGRPPGSGEHNHTVIFLSTPSARRATYIVRCAMGFRYISIHALREEGDAEFQDLEVGKIDFYPRPPRGGRLNGLHSRCEL